MDDSHVAHERLAIIETKQHAQHDFNERLIDEVTELRDDVRAIREMLATNKGFVAGMIFTVSGIGAVVGSVITHYVSGK